MHPVVRSMCVFVLNLFLFFVAGVPGIGLGLRDGDISRDERFSLFCTPKFSGTTASTSARVGLLLLLFFPCNWDRNSGVDVGVFQGCKVLWLTQLPVMGSSIGRGVAHTDLDACLEPLLAGAPASERRVSVECSVYMA